MPLRVLYTASTVCADLANDILHDENWDPWEFRSPHSDLLNPKYLDDAIPFVEALELDVNLPEGMIDIFIDDGITIIPDVDNNKTRGANAMPLAVHALFPALGH